MAFPTASNEAQIFNDDYDRLGQYKSDDSRLPYFNPADSGVDVLPGQPFLMSWAGTQVVVMSQAIIRPGELGMVTQYFNAEFPAVISANTAIGTAIYWDEDTNQAKLNADVTNGFILGYLTYITQPFPVGSDKPAVDGNDRAIAAANGATKVAVISNPSNPGTTKGTVTVH